MPSFTLCLTESDHKAHPLHVEKTVGVALEEQDDGSLAVHVPDQLTEWSVKFHCIPCGCRLIEGEDFQLERESFL